MKGRFRPSEVTPQGARPAPAPTPVDGSSSRPSAATAGQGSGWSWIFIDSGIRQGDVIVDLLGKAQREVGERSLFTRWTVAEEHLVTAVTQKALDVIAHAIEPPATAGLVVVACVEGNWRSLPAQMLAELLRNHGFAVAFLGASAPANHVAAFLSRRRPDALVVSCNLALFFGGVTRLADAAHRHDIPVLAGGQALGREPERAACLGADAWAPGVDDAVAVLLGWRRERPRVSAEPTPFKRAAVQVQLDLLAPEIAGEALGSLLAGYPRLRRSAKSNWPAPGSSSLPSRGSPPPPGWSTTRRC